jgi:tRNA (guanine37-N1)-methyltransferase
MPVMPAAQRVDVVSIFPDYLAPLGLSLIGKAREDGLLDVRVHDLRDFTHDRHRTVDDTPYGGGAGMVMKAQPWAEALEHLVADPVSASGSPARPRLIVPGPGGVPFSQKLAGELAREPWLAFLCGRYEGIDERVYEHAREDLGLEVTVVSLGDYVLNGGEVAVLAIVEAVARLIPGVIGNAESLVEESHEDGLLEYPIYTKPRTWQGREVPPVLLSGDHAAIAAWRQEQRLARTAARRPDLLHPSLAATDVQVSTATPGDLPELLTLLRAAGQDATMETLRVALGSGQPWLARRAGRLVGAIRTHVSGDTMEVTAPALAPDVEDEDLARHLLDVVTQTAVSGIRSLVLADPAPSAARARTYRKAGYRPAPAGWSRGVPRRG